MKPAPSGSRKSGGGDYTLILKLGSMTIWLRFNDLLFQNRFLQTPLLFENQNYWWNIFLAIALIHFTFIFIYRCYWRFYLRFLFAKVQIN